MTSSRSVAAEGSAREKVPSVALGRRWPVVGRIVVGVGAYAVLVGVALWRGGLDLAGIASLLIGSQLGYVVLALAAYYGSFPFRAWRWKLLLARHTPHPVSTKRLILPYLYSWLVNCAVPAKLGELYRCYLVQRRCAVPFSLAFGATLVERAADLVFVAVLLPLTTLLVFHGSGESEFLVLQLIAVLLTLGFLVALLSLRWSQRFSHRLPSVVRRPIASLAAGLAIDRSTAGKVFLFTVPLWSLEAARVFAEARALGLAVSLPVALLIALLAALLTTVPLTPAGIGAVEIGVVGLLMVLGLSIEHAAALALLDRLVAYWSVFLVAGIPWLAERLLSGRRP
jgi:uncharacterized membrane protein YbhN (UPF0104 family)